MNVPKTISDYYSLLDGLRRLECKYFEILLAKECKLPDGLRTSNKIRGFAYSNYLSSCHGLQDLIRSYCKVSGISNYYNTVEKAVKNDDLLN